eukprot:CAMPEP_0172362108 /NCGR_PEP_ID=MMETSP1060-20121228/5795_1 /TAXON_ID=37318 /ORGANISM="Pseudo-nitzschia pungens, Strain cf. cingulata" /LENGTH=191 /DNA_ID=CAMNT_0013084533 /DNA_START=126 /DNA_END=701 /DNA_ORIENTATION=+
MTRLLSAFGKAASFTAKGAAVTFGSTMFSCAAACSIEKSANRMILKYCPHKLVNVETCPSGITQEELNYVKLHYGGGVVVAATHHEESPLVVRSRTNNNNNTTEDSNLSSSSSSSIILRYDSFDDASEEDDRSTTIHATRRNSALPEEAEQDRSAVDRFWTEGEDAAAKYVSMIPAVIVPRQEILACSMTA